LRHANFHKFFDYYETTGITTVNESRRVSGPTKRPPSQ
jgi:hypothetical protein